MRESSVAPVFPVRDDASLPQMLLHNAAIRPERTGFVVREADGWRDVSHREFLDQVERLAKGLMAAGIDAGDRVALLSRTRYEWTLVDFAVLTVGAQVVPIYETSSPGQIAWILQDSAAKAIVVETDENYQSVMSVRDECPALRDVWHIDASHLEELAEGSTEISDAQLRARRDAITNETIATIIYTSGTTGRPKGCALTHGNFVGVCENDLHLMDALVNGDDNRGTLLFLPLAHVFARMIQYVAVCSGVRLGHTASIANLVDDLGTFRPSFLLAVPRVFEKVYNATEHKAHADGKSKAFAQAARVAINYSRAIDAGRRPALGVRIQHAIFDRLVYSKLRAAFGGQLRYSISGGAPLSTHLAHFYAGAGLPVLEGYGLTECTAPISVNPTYKMKIGTVGPPCPGVSVRIADDGEILAKGLNIFKEYINNPEATFEAKPDGWFHTGDLGELDEDGYLKITGRKKDLIITAGGKNVSPSKLEDVIRSNPLVSEAVVVGDNRPFVAAMVTLDEAMVKAWANTSGLDISTIEEARRSPAVRESIQATIDEANQDVSRAESVRKFIILSEQFTEENGQLTPSQKVKRHVVLTEFADVIDSEIYGS